MSSSAIETSIVNLLTFPSVSNDAFSNYKPCLDATSINGIITRSVSFSDSPPRKAARLEGDEDHSTAISRSREKGKGKEKQVDYNLAAITKIGIVQSPHDPVSQTYLDSLQGPLHSSICVVLDWKPNDLNTQKPTPMSYEWIYQATRSLVLIAKKGHWIYDKLRFELTESVKKIANSLIKLEPPDKILWLVQLVHAANWYDKSITRLEDLLTYLNRVYVSSQPDTLSIRQLAESIFQKFIFQHGLMTDYMKKGLMSWAEWERNNRDIHTHRPTVITLLDVMHTYGVLTHLFLNTYIFATQTYYKAESERLANSEEYKEPNSFLSHVAQRIEEEKQRSTALFVKYEWCARDIEGSTERSLMEGRLDWLSKGIVTSIDDTDMDSLRRMYKLFARVDGLKLLCDEFKLHVNNRVENIVKDVARDEEMVDRMLSFKAFIDRAISEAFVDEVSSEKQTKSSTSGPTITLEVENPVLVKIPSQRFVHAATDAFQAGFRARRNKPAEMIAKHIDRAMRKGQQDASDAEFSKTLDSILVLYRFTQDRDVFRTFYHRSLAKRLLLHRSASDDFEKAVLKRLKEDYDPEFSMGDQMFRDLALSRDIMNEFHNKPVGDGAGQQLTVMVLQRSFWPFSAKQREEILLPPAMQEVLTKYSIFYRNAHQGHKLDFDHSLGTMQLRSRFKAGVKELSVSLYQGVILLLFNDEDEMDFSEIKENTKMDDKELRRTLQSLACGNKKVLRKKPLGKDINDGDIFYFNNDFTDSRQKVHINSIQSKETPEETKRTQQSIEGDRKHYLDAAIVRIMKAKKTMAHQKLIQETILAVQGHFKPEVKVIKERIEQLIEQEYIRRDDDQDNVYVYVA